jgi:hypothetical protein
MRRSAALVLAVAVAATARGQAGQPVIDASALSSAELVEQARLARKQAQFDRAIWLLSVCVEREPKNLDCLSLLGSAYASRGAATANPKDQGEAARWYRRFIEVAPPTDPRVDKLHGYLGMARMPLDARTPVEPLRVVLTRPRIVRTREVVRVSVGDASVVVVTPQPSELRFEGKRPGTTRVTAWNLDGTTTRWDVTVEKE